MLSKTSTKQYKYILIIYTKQKMEIAKQNAKQRYYQKNKEKYIERVQKQREDKKQHKTIRRLYKTTLHSYKTIRRQ